MPLEGEDLNATFGENGDLVINDEGGDQDRPIGSQNDHVSRDVEFPDTTRLE